jgi:hypothetical protein
MCSPFAGTCSVAPREFAVFLKVSNRPQYRIAQRALLNPDVSSVGIFWLKTQPDSGSSGVAATLRETCRVAQKTGFPATAPR